MAAAATKKVGFLAKWGTRFTNMGNRTSVYWGKKLPVFKKYALVELMPPTPADIPQIMSEIKALSTRIQTKEFLNKNAHQLIISSVVCWEVIPWFFLGEIIGKRYHIGYKIEDAYDFNMYFDTSLIGL